MGRFDEVKLLSQVCKIVELRTDSESDLPQRFCHFSPQPMGIESSFLYQQKLIKRRYHRKLINAKKVDICSFYIRFNSHLIFFTALLKTAIWQNTS